MKAFWDRLKWVLLGIVIAGLAVGVYVLYMIGSYN